MNPIIASLQNKKIIILGFGKEGRSSYECIRKHLPKQPLTIADKRKISWNYTHDEFVNLICGEDYLEGLNNYDIILKSPGISFANLHYYIEDVKISSQTSLFLQYYHGQTIGVTGTKGKSTTASMIHHLLTNTHGNALLAGNIGKPVFDIIDQITPETWVVMELSAQQLEFVKHSPHISILLNLYQEHLDFFNAFNNYVNAKMNITQYQKEDDYLIYNQDDDLIVKMLQANNYHRRYFPFSRKKIIDTGAYTRESQIIIAQSKEVKASYPPTVFTQLRGGHNIGNGMAALMVCELLHLNPEKVAQHAQAFYGLEHRLEKVGKKSGIVFFNDSISTAAESTISALESVTDVDTLILGGADRGIDYSILYHYLAEHPVPHVIFTGPAGTRMLQEMETHHLLPPNTYLEEEYQNIVALAFQHTQKGKACLLSPAAPSFNAFKNFEERGAHFKQLIHDYENGNS